MLKAKNTDLNIKSVFKGIKYLVFYFQFNDSVVNCMLFALANTV